MMHCWCCCWCCSGKRTVSPEAFSQWQQQRRINNNLQCCKRHETNAKSCFVFGRPTLLLNYLLWAIIIACEYHLPNSQCLCALTVSSQFFSVFLDECLQLKLDKLWILIFFFCFNCTHIFMMMSVILVSQLPVMFYCLTVSSGCRCRSLFV